MSRRFSRKIAINARNAGNKNVKKTIQLLNNLKACYGVERATMIFNTLSTNSDNLYEKYLQICLIINDGIIDKDAYLDEEGFNELLKTK